MNRAANTIIVLEAGTQIYTLYLYVSNIYLINNILLASRFQNQNVSVNYAPSYPPQIIVDST